MDDMLQEAVRRAGGLRVLARALGVSHQAILQWNRAPPRRVLDIERLTGVPRHDLRPDLYSAGEAHAPPPVPPVEARAQTFEEGRQAGLRENLDQRAVDAVALSKTSQARLDAHEKRLTAKIAATVDALTRAGIVRHIDEHLMPQYKDLLAEAELLMKIGKPFTNKEYLSILRALHPDSSSVEYRHDAFLLVKARQVVLRPDERDRPLTSSLPKTLAELLARKKTKR